MKEPLILLPGMMCDARLFAPQIAALSTTHPVIVMPLTGQRAVSDIAKEILSNAPPRFALLGLSMGGIVAMEMTRQASERITRLALFDTNPMADTPERILLREEEITRVEAGELRAVIRDDMKPNYLAEGENQQAILNLCMSMAESHGPKVFVDQSKALQSRPDQCEALKQIMMPTLIACGEEDSLCPLEKHELMHKLVNGSQLRVIQRAGHLPTLEQPDATNQVINEWLTM